MSEPLTDKEIAELREDIKTGYGDTAEWIGALLDEVEDSRKIHEWLGMPRSPRLGQEPTAQEILAMTRAVARLLLPGLNLLPAPKPPTD